MGVLLACFGLAQAGTLHVGAPTIDGHDYSFPILLSGDVEQVAALDFRLHYDPEVFEPVSAATGR